MECWKSTTSFSLRPTTPKKCKCGSYRRKRNDNFLTCQECKKQYRCQLLSSENESNPENTSKSGQKSNQSLSKEKKERAEFLFELWSIRERDRDFISYSKEYRGFIDFKISLKAFQLSCFYNEIVEPLEDDILMKILFHCDNGINIKLLVEKEQVLFHLQLDDVEFCAAMFHDPFYFLCIKVNQATVDLYLKSLKQLNDSWRSDPDGILSNGNK